METNVYMINGDTLVASDKNQEETCNWFNRNYYSVDVKKVKHQDLDYEGMWWHDVSEEDIRRLGDCNVVTHGGPNEIGNLKKDQDGEIYKYMSFRDILATRQEFTPPFILTIIEE